MTMSRANTVDLVGKACILCLKPTHVYSHLDGNTGIILSYNEYYNSFTIFTIPSTDLNENLLAQPVALYSQAFHRSEFHVLDT